MAKRIKLGVLVMILFTSVAFALSNGLSYFQASYDGADVKLEWEMSNESGMIRYDVYRKSDSETSYKKVSSINPNGSLKYSYLDTELYKTNQSSNLISYRLSVVANSGEQQYFTTVSQGPSAVQRSWGSIKSMFR